MVRSSCDSKSYRKEEIQERKFMLKFLRSWRTGPQARDVRSRKWPINLHVRQWSKKGN